jgi:phosphoribosylamine--glycine ligase
MRVLGIGGGMDLGSMYLRLTAGGHQVRVFVADPEARGTLLGMIDTVSDWRPELDWVRQAGAEGFIVFETSTQGELQDQLRAAGFQVIGGSAYGDRLENDRAFGQQIMGEVGMRVAPTHAFEGFEEAIRFVSLHPDTYVYKPCGGGFASGRTFVGQLENGSDMVAYLDLQRRHWPPDEPTRMVLMKRLHGVEVGVGAYFDGGRFLEPTCLDWEHKRFFTGDLGELTGEMGTLVTFRHNGRLFEETLGRMEGRLAAGGYRGYLNLNTIVDDGGVHPLEFTCRFGYPGFSILEPLQVCGWDELFRRMVGRGPPGPFPTHDGFAVGVVLTVPPFPYSAGYEKLSKGLPVIFRSNLSDLDRPHLHWGEVALDGAQLVTSGSVGYIMVVTGRGPTAVSARRAAYELVAKVCLSNGRYRTDIGERFLAHDQARLTALGWL